MSRAALETLQEIKLRLDGRGMIVLHWPSRRQYLLKLEDIDEQGIYQGVCDEAERVKQESGKRVWNLRCSV